MNIASEREETLTGSRGNTNKGWLSESRERASKKASLIKKPTKMVICSVSCERFLVMIKFCPLIYIYILPMLAIGIGISLTAKNLELAGP